MTLLESLSAIVYHSTSIDSLHKILNTNQFVLSTSMGTKSDALNKRHKMFYMSLSNVKNSGFDVGTHKDVKLVLNGDKLNTNYHSSAVDYWGRDFRNAAMTQASNAAQNASWSKSLLQSATRPDENESRLFSDSAIIKNAKSYIIEIHILYDSYENYINEIIKYADDIPIYWYKDKSAFELLDKKKSIDINSITFVPNKLNEREKITDDNITALRLWCQGDRSSPQVQDLLNISEYDRVSVLFSDIHNNKSNPKHSHDFNIIAKYMKSKKYSSVAQVINEISEYIKDVYRKERMKLEQNEKERIQRNEMLQTINDQLSKSTKAILTIGDVDPYTYGGFFFFKDGNRIDVVAFDDSSNYSISDNQCMMTRLSFDDPRTESWIDLNKVSSEVTEIKSFDDLARLYIDCVYYYGVENFGSNGYEPRNKARMMLTFPTADLTAEEVFRELWSAENDEQ